jgi:hypothetical protein
MDSFQEKHRMRFAYCLLVSVILVKPLVGQLPAADEVCWDYPDFGYINSTTIPRTLFKLSQSYPKTLPEKLPAFFKPDMNAEAFQAYYQKNWREYTLAVRDYCFEGNIEVDWRVEENKVRKWYHMPWLHWGRFGREGLRGLTKEAPISSRQLASTQSSSGQTYAVALYNDRAAYLIGQVWKNSESPDVSAIAKLNGFAQGSVIFKLLFADIPVTEVPALENAITWDAYITDGFGSDNRKFCGVHLIQMDFMVKDDRAPTGWLFGTYQYNGKLNKANPWENLIPVGLQWGNDPDVTSDEFTNAQPMETKINPAIKESVINPDTTELPATHLGWNGRLNGPVDNPRSSCLSCHMVAHHPYDGSLISPLFMPDSKISVGPGEWMDWFQNLNCMTPFRTGMTPTDSSLQLAMSIANFNSWKDKRGGHWTHSPPTQCELNSKN